LVIPQGNALSAFLQYIYGVTERETFKFKTIERKRGKIKINRKE
jgi:hypothetical protein